MRLHLLGLLPFLLTEDAHSEKSRPLQFCRHVPEQAPLPLTPVDQFNLRNLLPSTSRITVFSTRTDGVAESFFNLLMRERIRGRVHRSRDKVRQDMFDYIEIFCNPTRVHVRNRMLRSRPVRSIATPAKNLDAKRASKARPLKKRSCRCRLPTTDPVQALETGQAGVSARGHG